MALYDTLNQDQKDAAAKFERFLLSDDKEFYLFGAAGCGKTYLLQYLLTEGIKKYKRQCAVLGKKVKYKYLALTAPTNKAVEVLEQYRNVSFELPLKFITTTYSLFEIRVEENYKNGTTELGFPGNSNGHQHAVIVVDECSMLPQEVLGYIRRNSPHCKLLFVGDNFQLAPVNGEAYWNNTPDKVTAYLRSPIRNKDQKALVDLCNQLRDTVNTLAFHDIKLHKGTIDLLNDDEALAWIQNADFDKNRILSYTNNKVLKYISLIEQQQGTSKFIQEGRSYVNNTSFAASSRFFFYPEEMVCIEEITSNNHLWEALPSQYYLSVIVARVRSLRNPKKVFNCVIATDPRALKERILQAAQNKNWAVYFTLKKNVMDLRLPYASTIHKAQGSTFDEVFLDLDSFRSCKDPETAARLLYVAASRAKNRLVLYGKLPKKYGKLV